MQKILVYIFEKYRFVRSAYSFLTPPGFFDRFNHIEVETTSFCNRKCGYCPNVENDKLNSSGSFLMDENILDKVISDLRLLRFAGTFSPHMYGEPLLDPRIHLIIKRISDIGAKPKIYTNADYLTPDLLSKLIQNGLHTLFISKHSRTLSRGAKEALQGLFDQIPRFKGRDVMSICSELEDRVLVVNGLTFRIRDYYSDFRGKSRYLHNRGGSLNLALPDKGPPIACQYTRYPVIDVEGNIVLCCNDYHGRYVMGNIMDRSLKEIWTDYHNKKLRKRIYRGKLDLKICKECRL